jgi:two-component system, chemotaxis family, CheB/CheR fusion protein
LAKREAGSGAAVEAADDGAADAPAGFPIVGIGASAGGLEALEQFLSHVPPACGMAFIVIQHLDPTRKGIMPELLQRATPMRVAQAENRMAAEPDRVYVIPPNKDMSLLHGRLHLLDPLEPRGLRLPIDFFFRSLADDRHEGAIGVILSGMGSDGTLGLKAIKERGGLVLVQDPVSARFDGMPRSAIVTGLADIVAPADALPGRLIAACRHPLPRGLLPAAGSKDAPQSAVDKIMILLRAHTGQDFSLYKKSTVHRRIERRMGIHQIDRWTTYVRFLQENPVEVDLLFKELLIGVTSFFRDPAAWASLREHALPALLAERPSGGDLRAWVPACSTGEEAYSLVIVLREVLERLEARGRFTPQVFATDLDQDAIARAREGFYPANIAADVGRERLERFFVEEPGGGYRVTKDVREAVIFAPQNVLSDPPFTRLDLLSCRNLLIYLSSELQNKLQGLFHYSLNAGGILFLGSAETIGGHTDLFVPLDRKNRLYQRLGGAPDMATLEFPTRGAPTSPEPADIGEAPRPTVNLQGLTEKLILGRFAPAAVLVNGSGDIVYISGRTGKYLEPAAGKANWNIHAMAREGLRLALSMALQKAKREATTVKVGGLTVGTDGDQRVVDLVVEAITEPSLLRGMTLIVFQDVATPAPDQAGATGAAPTRATPIAALEAELAFARAETRTLREEMQTSQEELRSANEELQSTNEELQSTNEELTTSKEEMQSLNEELQTVNAELQSKVEDLSRTSDDMRNLLDSTDIATVFLDGRLRVRRFTLPTTRLINLIPGDVGRPLSDIVSHLDYPDLHADAQEVLRTLVFSEKQVATRDGRWYSVRIMPYRTLNNVIDGVVITFFDLARGKAMAGKSGRGEEA